MRIVQLLTALLDASGPVEISTMARRMSVSQRTIQNDLSFLRAAGPEHGFEVTTKRGRGVAVVVQDPRKVQGYVGFLSMDGSLPTEKRPSAILQLIALARGYVSTEELADGLSLSTGTVNHTLPEVIALASRYGFEIERTRHHGTRVTGSPVKLREYLAAAYVSGDRAVIGGVAHLETGIVGVTEVLSAALGSEGIRLNYEEYKLLRALLLMTVVMSPLAEEGSLPGLPVIDSRAGRVAEKVSEAVARNMGVFLSAGDAAFFGGELAKRANLSADMTYGAAETRALILAFLTKVDERYGSSYLEDCAFIDMLDAHVALLVSRLMTGTSFSNPFAQEIQVTKPLCSDLAVQLCEELTKRYGVIPSTDEVAFIAMHFAAHDERVSQNRMRGYARIVVVCSTGGGAATLVKMQLESVFPDACIEALSYLEQKRIKEIEPDLVFTMVPLSEAPCAPTLYIKEILSDSDLLAIRKTIQHGPLEGSHVVGTDSTVSGLIAPELFARTQASSYEGVIRSTVADCVRLGHAPEELLDLVMTRERFASTIYMNGVCIPHPVEAVATRAAIAVRILEIPLREDGRDISIVFLPCLTKELVGLYKPISQFLYGLMRDPGRVRELLSSTSSDQLVQRIRKMEVHDDE